MSEEIRPAEEDVEGHLYAERPPVVADEQTDDEADVEAHGIADAAADVEAHGIADAAADGVADGVAD